MGAHVETAVVFEGPPPALPDWCAARSPHLKPQLVTQAPAPDHDEAPSSMQAMSPRWRRLCPPSPTPTLASLDVRAAPAASTRRPAGEMLRPLGATTPNVVEAHAARSTRRRIRGGRDTQQRRVVQIGGLTRADFGCALKRARCDRRRRCWLRDSGFHPGPSAGAETMGGSTLQSTQEGIEKVAATPPTEATREPALQSPVGQRGPQPAALSAYGVTTTDCQMGRETSPPRTTRPRTIGQPPWAFAELSPLASNAYLLSSAPLGARTLKVEGKVGHGQLLLSAAPRNIVPQDVAAVNAPVAVHTPEVGPTHGFAASAQSHSAAAYVSSAAEATPRSPPGTSKVASSAACPPAHSVSTAAEARTMVQTPDQNFEMPKSVLRTIDNTSGPVAARAHRERSPPHCQFQPPQEAAGHIAPEMPISAEAAAGLHARSTVMDASRHASPMEWQTTPGTTSNVPSKSSITTDSANHFVSTSSAATTTPEAHQEFENAPRYSFSDAVWKTLVTAAQGPSVMGIGAALAQLLESDNAGTLDTAGTQEWAGRAPLARIAGSAASAGGEAAAAVASPTAAATAVEATGSAAAAAMVLEEQDDWVEALDEALRCHETYEGEECAVASTVALPGGQLDIRPGLLCDGFACGTARRRRLRRKKQAEAF